ncbi:hypothetical protein GR11A_00243 [Vibrio phage vB_VcorM_GR11A]|nr:hypothetical protein GR11A_00243 [Vibrio phage vB_VcorM_GR11A]
MTTLTNEVKGAIELVNGKPVIKLNYIAQWQGRNAWDINKQVVRSPLSEEFKAEHAAPTTYTGRNGQQVRTHYVTLEGLLAMSLVNVRGTDGVELIDILSREMVVANRQDKAAARINELEAKINELDINAQDDARTIEGLRYALIANRAHPTKQEAALEHFAGQVRHIHDKLEDTQRKLVNRSAELKRANTELSNTRASLATVRSQMEDMRESSVNTIKELKAKVSKKKVKPQQRVKKVKLVVLNEKGQIKLKKANNKLVERLEQLEVESQNKVRELMNDGVSAKKAMKQSGFSLLV